MSPGPVAVNAAVGYGYKIAGFPGAVACFFGIVIPCAVIVIVVATFFFKIYNHTKVQAALYGLRPTITGVILYAAISIAIKNNILAAKFDVTINKGFYLKLLSFNLFEVKSMIIVAVTFVILKKTKVSPIFLILGS